MSRLCESYLPQQVTPLDRWVYPYAEGRLSKDVNGHVAESSGKGADIADIARTVGVSRHTVYRYLSLDGPPERKRPIRTPRPARLAWEAFIVRRWDDGCHNGRRLWREARAAGHACAESNVARFVAQLRRAGV